MIWFFLCSTWITILTGATSNDPILGLLQRRVGKSRASSFSTSVKPRNTNSDDDDHHQFFTISAGIDDTISVVGSDLISIGRGIREYFETYANASFSWNATGGDNVLNALPPPNEALPSLTGVVSKTSSSKFRYYFNTCTYGYSMFSWEWQRWEREIDWMVLQGINNPLSMLGAEFIWKKTFMETFQLSREDLNTFFSGAAFLPWHWMGNLDGWGGPLTDQVGSWFDWLFGLCFLVWS